jgi:FKBP-type peptidyl-prolyl cis-trans isomerase
MKRQVKIATLLVAGMTLLAACSNDGFKTTDGGLHYRFDKVNKDGQQVQEGDVLVGEMTFKFDTMTLFTNVGKADRIMQASPNFPGNLHEGLLLMHVGDQATFAIEADTLAKFMQPDQMPPTYQRGTGQKFYYEINLQDIVTKEELEEEREAFMAEAQQRQENEPQMIADYVRDNGIAAKPNADGLYVIVKKRGNGPKVATGKEVAVNYTGRLLDGTMFDSSVESDAKEGDIHNPQRTYEPLTYTQGRGQLIPGWEQGVEGQPEGSQLQLIIPSALGYGPRGAGQLIPPFSPLVFDIEIVSVK